MQTQDLKLTIKNNIATLTFDMQDSKANTLSKSVLEQLETILNHIKTNSEIHLLLIQSAKEGMFIAGADIKEILPMTNANEIYAYLLKVDSIFTTLEHLPFPSVALIDGACMGGGLELALCCTYRLATSNKKTKLSFPEIKLGFFPGFGGTQRLPKLIGLIHSLELILQAKELNAQQAYKIGLVNEFFAEGYSEFRTEEFIQNVLNKKVKSKKTFRWMEYFNFTREFIFKKSLEKLKQKVHPKYFGPYSALDVIHHTFKMPHKKGIEIEARTFSEVATTQESKNLIELFLISQELKKEYENKELKEKISQTEQSRLGTKGRCKTFFCK